MNNNEAAQVPTTAPAHVFGGIDGRCWECDARPGTMLDCIER